MKVCFYPVGDITRASSRYRVYWIVAEQEEFIIGDEKNWKDADVLVFQRTLHEKHYQIAKAAHEAGKLVILDITDFHQHRTRWKMMSAIERMAKVAHCITTGNEDDAHEIRQVLNKKCYVIPGAQKMSSLHRKHSNVPVPTVVWLGRENTMKKTLGAIWPVFVRLTQRGIRFRVLIVNDSGNTQGLVLLGNQVVGRKWKLDEVYRVVSQCDVGVCPQVKMEDGRYHKDENKAVTCWTCGVPCVSFARTKDWDGDLGKFLTDWRFRATQGRRGIERAKQWAPKAVAQKWLEVIGKELRLH